MTKLGKNIVFRVVCNVVFGVVLSVVGRKIVVFVKNNIFKGQGRVRVLPMGGSAEFGAQ